MHTRPGGEGEDVVDQNVRGAYGVMHKDVLGLSEGGIGGEEELEALGRARAGDSAERSALT